MNTKNKLIKNLLKVAKKHKVLTYPVLALVAIISFVSYFFSWSNGAGKRVVAVVMALVMLVSQSYFLTSSATTVQDDANASLVQEELKKDKLVNSDEQNNIENGLDLDNNSKESSMSSEEISTESMSTEKNESSENLSSEEDKSTEMVENSSSQNISTEEQMDNGEKVEKTTEVASNQVSTERNGTATTFEVLKNQANLNFYYTLDGQSRTLISASSSQPISANDDNNTYNVSSQATSALETAKKSYSNNNCYNFDGWYYDMACTEKIEDLSKVLAKEEDGKTITLHCKGDLVKYQVEIVKADKEDASIQFNTSVSPDEFGTYYIPIQSTDSGKTASFTISNIVRKGYQIESADVTSPSNVAVNSDGNSLAITFSGDTLKRKVTLKWIGDNYQIKYAKNEAGDIIQTQNITYDSQENLFINGEGIVEEKEGYKFDGWKIGNTETVVKPGTLVSLVQDQLYPSLLPQDEENIKILYPQYKYDGVEITKNKIDYEYKKAEKTITISGRYKGKEIEGSKNFKYKLISGADTIKEYGIDATASDNGIVLKTSGPTKKTSADGIELQFTITDDTAPMDEKTTTHIVKVHVAPRVVVVDVSDNTVKTYDKKKDTYLKSPVNTNVDGVTISFTNSQYNSENVKDASYITLSDPTLIVPRGENSENYVLYKQDGECRVPASISPRAVYLKTFAVLEDGKKFIRSGEANPRFRVEEDLSENTQSIGLLKGDTIEKLGDIKYSTNRNDLTTSGIYKISAEAAATSNYKVKIDDVDKGTFEVKQEKPELDGNFTVSGTKGNVDWYITNPAQIKSIPASNYDTVRISKDGKTVLTEASIVSISEKEFPKNADIYVQLYDTRTKAVTSWEKVHINIDETAPEYISYLLKQDENLLYDSNPSINGLYFPTKGMVTFGNYFNKTVNVIIKYKDITSGLSKLHYGLYGEDSNTRDTLFTSTDEDGYATATFEILKEAVEKAGIIKYYAEDAAGNKGQEYQLVRDGASEWSVETTGPNVELFVVKAGEKQLETVVSGSKEFYANCTANLSVKDTVSGIYSVTWMINGVSYPEEKISNNNAKQIEWLFKKDINAKTFPSLTGEYEVYAIIKDNSQNEVRTDSINFKVDDQAPEINITTEFDKWLPDVKLSFNTQDDLSGIKYINVTDANGDIVKHHVEKVDGKISYCYFETKKKGNYKVIVSDYAGNVTEKEIVLDKVSSEVPECPSIMITPEDALNESGWYTKIPSITISNVTETSDATPVVTKYQLWKEGDTPYNATSIPKGEVSYTTEVPGEGEYNLKVWSESATGILCDKQHEYKFIVDTLVPKIEYTTKKGTGSTIIVDFTVTDEGSGVNSESIKVLHGVTPINVKIEETEAGYIGSFEIKETGNYSITAADLAGNVSDEAAFTPMSMKIKAVTNITESGAVLGADIIKGTFDITSVSLAYRKITDTDYIEVESITSKDENGNLSISAILENLEKGTNYAFKVMAVSEADEILEYEGYFKTIVADAKGIQVKGTAKYPGEKDAMITVALFDGNVCVMAKEIKAGEEFFFDPVPDGNYNIIATDGKYRKTTRLLVKDGKIVYPENYIELILSGMNTTVEIVTEDTPKISVDNMDSIFVDDTVNFTEDDQLLIESGGTVEFKLYATLMRVTDVSAEEIAAMYAATDSNKVVGAYIDLSLYKILNTPNGETKRTRISNLASGASLSVTIPLEEFAGKPGLEVVRIHDNGNEYVGKSMIDMDTNPTTYTITTNQFSTYAVLYSVDKKTEEPTTQELTTEEPTTQEPTTQEPTTEQIKVESPNSSENDIVQNTTEDKEESHKDKDKDKKPSSSVSSLTSSGSAQTGDEAPIALFIMLFVTSFGGIVLIKRKVK